MGVENYIFGLKSGQDLKNRAAHLHQEFPGVPPGWNIRQQSNFATLPCPELWPVLHPMLDPTPPAGGFDSVSRKSSMIFLLLKAGSNS